MSFFSTSIAIVVYLRGMLEIEILHFWSNIVGYGEFCKCLPSLEVRIVRVATDLLLVGISFWTACKSSIIRWSA